MPRPTPFDLVFSQIAERTFPEIRGSIERAGYEPTDRDAFLMIPEVVSLLRELRPEEGVGEGMDQLVALLHHVYVLWDAGGLTLPVLEDRLAELLGSSFPATTSTPPEPPRAYYAQFPQHQVWAEVLEGESHEPLDGCFVHSMTGGNLRVLGVFGVRPERLGFSVVEAEGPWAPDLRRPDGSRLFSPVLPGGVSAGLHSIAGGEELLELGWRTRAMATELLAPAR
ncbi:MAG: hypothetical protein ACJ8DC_16040 [Gemmatimonadales bacterium]